MTKESTNYDHKINSLTAKFSNPFEESLFRAEMWSEWSRQLRTVVVVMAILIFSWIYVDYLAIGITPAFWWLFTIKSSFVGFAIGLVIITLRENFSPAADVGALIFVLFVLVVGCSGMVMKKDPAPSYTMGAIMLILYLYVLVPNRFLWAMGSIVLGTFLFILTSIYVSNPTYPELVRITLYVATVNLAGAATAYRAHKLHRMRFVTVEMLRREVEERKRAEIALKIAHDEAQEAVMAKNHFIAAASHDLRQPTQSLMLFSALLQQNDLGDASNRAVDGIVQSTKALQQLLNSLLDISRLEAGLIEPDCKSFQLSEVIERLVTEISPQAKEKGLRFRAVSPNTITVNTDPTLLERTLRNLLTNAVQYTDKGGILIGCRRSGNMIRIEVWDTGEGIAEDMRGKIFDDFFQIGSPGREQFKGLGLGLSTVQRMADILGLSVALRSVVGKGSVFSIEVPISQITPVATKEATPTAPVTEEERLSILVIDDDVNILKSFKELVELWGHRVMTAESEADAERALEQADIRPDLIVADYRLHNGQTGIQAISKLRQRVGDDVRAAILTGDTAPELLQQMASVGLDILHKPLDAEELRGLLAGTRGNEVA